MLGIVIGIIAWILFAKDYRSVVNFIQLQLPDNKKNLLVEIKQVFSNTILKMVKAYLLIMFITFCELSLGFTILSIAGIMSNSYIYSLHSAYVYLIFSLLQAQAEYLFRGRLYRLLWATQRRQSVLLLYML